MLLMVQNKYINKTELNYAFDLLAHKSRISILQQIDVFCIPFYHNHVTFTLLSYMPLSPPLCIVFIYSCLNTVAARSHLSK